jgi:hypothetical protein
MWPFGLRPRVGGYDVEPVNVHMPAAHVVAREKLHAAANSHAVQFDPAKRGNGSVIEDRPLFARCLKVKAVNTIVGGQLIVESSAAPHSDRPGGREIDGASVKWPLTTTRWTDSSLTAATRASVVVTHFSAALIAASRL